jgi:hypothetical protein
MNITQSWSACMEPMSARLSGSAPASTSICTMSACPSRDAIISAVRPACKEIRSRAQSIHSCQIALLRNVYRVLLVDSRSGVEQCFHRGIVSVNTCKHQGSPATLRNDIQLSYTTSDVGINSWFTSSTALMPFPVLVLMCTTSR